MLFRKKLGGEADGSHAVVETDLISRRSLRLQVVVPDHLIIVQRVLKPVEELAQIGRPKAPAEGPANPQVLGDPEQATGPRHEVAAVQAVVVETAPKGQYEPLVKGDAVVDPEIGHVDSLARIVSQNPVVSPVLILSPLQSAL